MEEFVAFTADDAHLLDSICTEHGVPTELVVRLLDVERAAHGLKRRHAVHTRIEELFHQEWRSLEAILAERHAERGANESSEVVPAPRHIAELPLFDLAEGDADAPA